jgi:tRNA threonylcarbamoyladenosine biosynthesis protein TsaE
MGAGKSTFARFLLGALKVEQPPEGSPSFAIAHFYDLPASAKARGVAHIDLYRIKSEDEIDEAGLTDLCWNPELISLVEWASLWPEFENALERPSPVVWRVELAFSADASKREVGIKRLV